MALKAFFIANAVNINFFYTNNSRVVASIRQGFTNYVGPFF